jgi:membrane protein
MLKKFVLEAIRVWNAERPVQYAAALAYFGMFAFAPLIYIVLSFLGFFADQTAVASMFYARVESTLGPDVAAMIQNSVSSLANSTSEESFLVSIISVVSLFYAASGVFFQLQQTLNRMWHLPIPENEPLMLFVRHRLVSFAMVIGVGLIGIAALFINLILSWFGSLVNFLVNINPNQSLVVSASTLIVLAITFALIYKFLPETKIGWKDVWLGAIVAATVIMGMIKLAGLYFQLSSMSSALQVAGDVSLLLLGFFYIAQIFLAGAVICRVYAGQFGSRKSTEI